MIVSTEYFCTALKNYVENKLKINCKIYNHSLANPVIKRFHINSTKDSYLFLNWLYTNSSIHMNRKHQSFLELENNLINYKEPPKRICCMCPLPYHAKGYCSKHYAEKISNPRANLS